MSSVAVWASLVVACCFAASECRLDPQLVDEDFRARQRIAINTRLAVCRVSETVSHAYAMRTSLHHIVERLEELPTLPLLLLLVDDPSRHPAAQRWNDTTLPANEQLVLAKDDTDLGYLPRVSTEDVSRLHNYISAWATPYADELVLFPFGCLEQDTAAVALRGREFIVTAARTVQPGERVAQRVPKH